MSEIPTYPDETDPRLTHPKEYGAGYTDGVHTAESAPRILLGLEQAYCAGRREACEDRKPCCPKCGGDPDHPSHPKGHECVTCGTGGPESFCHRSVREATEEMVRMREALRVVVALCGLVHTTHLPIEERVHVERIEGVARGALSFTASLSK